MYDTATSTAQCPQNWWKFFGFFWMDSYTRTKGVMAYGLCNIFLILTALLLPSHNCVNGRKLLLSKISNRYSLKFKLTRYYENDSYPQMREIYCTVIQLWSEHFLYIPRNKYWTVLIADKLYTNWIHMCLVHPISHLQLLMS